MRKIEGRVIESGDGGKAKQTSEREEKQKRKVRERERERDRRYKFSKFTLCPADQWYSEVKSNGAMTGVIGASGVAVYILEILAFCP